GRGFESLRARHDFVCNIRQPRTTAFGSTTGNPSVDAEALQGDRYAAVERQFELHVFRRCDRHVGTERGENDHTLLTDGHFDVAQAAATVRRAVRVVIHFDAVC